jgi:NAD(P)H-hydrate epimerase
MSPNALAIHRQGVWPLVTGAEMQALDRSTIETRGIASEILMESAGRALVRPALELRALSTRTEAPIRAFCGAGNNGGDGFVLVRHLWAEGIAAEAVLIGDPSRLPRDAASNWKRLEAIGAPRQIVDPGDEETDWDRLLSETSVAVDALFGTGLKREIAGGFARLIESIDTARVRGLAVLAVDIPSGVSAHSGRVLGVAVSADRTLTLSLPKVGLALEPGRSHAGKIEVARIGIADPEPGRLPRVELWNAGAAARHFPPRVRAGHKGIFGHVLVVAGSRGMMGAACLCARASLRSGAGLVTLAHPGGLAVELAGLSAEVMTAEVAATDAGGFARAAEKDIEELAASRDVLALGPGLGRASEAIDLVRRLVISIDCPIVLDADGLFGLSGQLELLHDREAPLVLTPHPGEAARLLETDVGHLNADRVDAARRLAERSRAVVVLKGAGTVVSDPTGRVLIIPTGGPVLASGGTGDVLTGIVAALLASGRPAFEAAALAAWWHGATADRLDPGRVGFGLLASEIADGLPACAAEIMDSNALREPDGDLDLRFP